MHLNPTSRRRPSPVSRRRGALAIVVAIATLVPLTMALVPAGAAATPVPTVRLSLTDVTAAVVPRGGGPGVVRATIVNDGTTAATGVRLRYHLPAGIELDAAGSPGCTVAAATVTCLIGTIAPGVRTPIGITVREPLATAVLGTRAGYFLAPTSDGYDPGSGEVLMTTWFHDAGAEATDLALCWPIANPTPNMDVAGGTCDGANDTAALEPDEQAALDAFPAPFSQSVTRSWQFDTEITAPTSGQYRACGTRIDDGGYLAIAPVGQPLTDASVAVNVLEFGSVTGPAFSLVAGQRYRVVMRVSNRGFAGIDDGANGGTLAGWDAYGIAPAAAACGITDAAVFGTADSAWVQRTVADVVVVGTSDVGITGAIESAPIDGHRQASVRIANDGPDATSARVAITLPPGSSLDEPITGCDRPTAVPSTTCELDELAATPTTAPTAPNATAGKPETVLSLVFSGTGGGVTWSTTTSSTVDANPANNDAATDI